MLAEKRLPAGEIPLASLILLAGQQDAGMSWKITKIPRMDILCPIRGTGGDNSPEPQKLTIALMGVGIVFAFGHDDQSGMAKRWLMVQWERRQRACGGTGNRAIRGPGPEEFGRMWRLATEVPDNGLLWVPRLPGVAAKNPSGFLAFGHAGWIWRLWRYSGARGFTPRQRGRTE